MNIQEEIDVVKEGLNSTLRDHKTWCLLSCKWYERWKQYVHNMKENDHPGMITNMDFLEPFDETLPIDTPVQISPDSIEGLHYIVLPLKYYYILKNIYNSDVDVIRDVIMIGQTDTCDGIPQIEINPIRVNVFLVENETEGRDEELNCSIPNNVFEFSRLNSLTSTIQSILDKLDLDPPPPYCDDSSEDLPLSSVNVISNTPKVRFWAKISTTAAASSLMTDDFTSTSFAASAAAPTSYIAEKTDVVGDYMYLRDLGTPNDIEYKDMILENAGV